MEYTETTERIAVSKEAYFYLWNKGQTQRGGKEMPPERQEITWKHLQRHGINNLTKTESGLKILDKNALGGVDKNGRKCVWSVDDLRRLLKEAGYVWEELGEYTYTCIPVSIPR